PHFKNRFTAFKFQLPTKKMNHGFLTTLLTLNLSYPWVNFTRSRRMIRKKTLSKRIHRPGNIASEIRTF
ncbi:hypothetical protein, partial [Leptospira weilii]|uniref:hypothetical protein n=1 Tax=Leptospira weilii TaxID=28184 RepID=UPI001F24FC2C